MLDMASHFNLQVTTGDVLFIVVPRDMLPAHVEKLHGSAVKSGMGHLLADYFNSLSRNLINLSHADMPYAAQATRNMLLACLSPTSDTFAHAGTELDAILRERVSAYIDKHLLNQDLKPDLICRDVGISRSRLYRIFEASGGVACQIQRKRLLRIRSILENPVGAKVRIAEVAWRNGFANEKGFSRAFKAEFGYTPRDTVYARRQRIIADKESEPMCGMHRTTFGEWLRQSR